jgi:hypothetical protein
MKDKTLERFAWITVFLLGLMIIAAFVGIGWAFVEIVQWLTSK